MLYICINNLFTENDIGQENIAIIFEYLNISSYDIGKKILNCLYLLFQSFLKLFTSLLIIIMHKI